jgi:hypothetical protein
MPHIASLNNPAAGLGLHQLGGRAQQWLAWNLKVGRSNVFLVHDLCFIHDAEVVQAVCLVDLSIGLHRVTVLVE